MKQRDKLTVLVTDGDERPALAITRSLGRRGVSVLVGGERAGSLASSSAYCLRHVTYPSPYRHPEAFEHFLLDFLSRERVDLVMPVTDVTTHAVARQRNAIQRYCAVAAPPFEAFDFVTDKWSLLQRAARCGITIPSTHFVHGAGGLGAVLDDIEYPVVVKPVRSRIRTDRGWTPTSVHYAKSESDLVDLYRDTGYLTSYGSLIQERISGPGIGVFALCDRGRLVATFAHRRLREKPPSGGVSVLSESIAIDPDLRDQAARLLGSVEWHGVAMLEYKQDRRTGRSYLMEVNGRFWGSLQLAVDAGVDFPCLSAQLALGQPLDVPSTYETGVRSRWFLGDLDHLYLRVFQRDRNLPDWAPSRRAALSDFFKRATPAQRSEVFRLEDPRPAFYELGRYLKDASGSAWKHLTQKSSDSRHASSSRIGPVTLCWALACKVVDYLQRMLACAAARRRMNGIRRDPALLTGALRRARSALVVCHGNIIRSPFAARFLQRELGAAGTVAVSSAGLEAIPGRPPHETALQMANAWRVDLTGHSARRLAPDVIAGSDVIFVMDIPQLVQLRKRFPEARARTFLLTCLAPSTPLEVGDPINGDESVFEACFNHISSAADPIVRVLSESAATL